MANNNTLTVYSASAGTGKTYTLASRYIALLLDRDDPNFFRHILAVTFTNKATAEMKRRILGYLFMIGRGDDQDPGRTDFIENIKGFLQYKHIEKNKDGKEIIRDKKPTLDSPKPKELRQKAIELLDNILWEYQNMRVVTIDSFLQTLLTGMARMAGLSADFTLELDFTHTVAEAVDTVMTADNQNDAKLNTVLSEYINEQLNREKGWDIRESLKAMTKELLKEAALKESDNITFNPQKIKEYKDAIDFNKAPCMIKMTELYDNVISKLQHSGLKGNNGYYQLATRVGNSLNGKLENNKVFNPKAGFDKDKLKNNLKDAGCSRQQQNDISDTLEQINDLCPECREVYLTWVITTQYLNDLSVMNFVKDAVHQNLEEANRLLQARTAYVLSSALKPGDADFILEKAGIRYRHIMIDEFQDTSSLQWQIFEQLFREVLSAEGTALVVGDIKQSIYRWRNGDYHIMKGLIDEAQEQENGKDPEHYRIQRKDLTRNYRSYPTVVDFNLRLFNNLIQNGQFANNENDKFADIYREGKDGYKGDVRPFVNKKGDGGYVQMKIFGNISKPGANEKLKLLSRKNVGNRAIQEMFNTIVGLLDKGVAAGEILILVAKNSQAQLIADKFNQHNDLSKRTHLVSSDSFKLESSQSVLMVVNALKYIFKRENVAKEFILLNKSAYNLPEDIISKLEEINKPEEKNVPTPLNELVETVVRLMLCQEDGKMKSCVKDTAYLNCFIDEVHNYVRSYGSNLKGMLQYWEDKIHAQAIPASSNDGVRVLTIHSAKGLEAHTVFVPFCNWPLLEGESAFNMPTLWVDAPTPYKNDKEKFPLIPVDVSKYMNETGHFENAYKHELSNNHLDKLNMLYVALTRAKANLYIYTYVNDSTDIQQPKNISDVILSASDDAQTRVKQIIEYLSNYKNSDTGNYADTKEIVPIETLFWGKEPETVNKARQTASKISANEDKDMANERMSSKEEGKTSKEEGKTSPFEPPTEASAMTVKYDYLTSDRNIRFRQSQEAMQYFNKNAEEAQYSIDKIQSGIVRHDVFAHIATKDEADKVVDDFLNSGRINSARDAEKIKQEIHQTWKNKDMSNWFSGKWNLLREVSILRPQKEYEDEMREWEANKDKVSLPMPKRELRPDRVMIHDGQAVVLDFKFGKPHKEHRQQVRQYMRLMQQMGYKNVKGWLWYAQDYKLEPVVQLTDDRQE